MRRFAWILPLLLVPNVLAAEGEPPRISDAARARFGFARSLLLQGGVPFEPELLLQPDWQTRLRSQLEAMPEMQTDREELSGRLRGVYLARTLVLPDKVRADGDVVILARKLVFLGHQPAIVAPGRNVGLFLLEPTRYASREPPLTGRDRPSLRIYTGSLTQPMRGEEELLREIRSWFCGGDSTCPDRDGGPGPSGTDGEPGTPGLDGIAVGHGANGGCLTRFRDGGEGPLSNDGTDGTNGGHGQPGGVGQDGGDIICLLAPLDTGTYHFSAKGGKGGRGGSGGEGGAGGAGGQGGRGGHGASCGDCAPGSGGRGGNGGGGGRAGRGGHASNGGWGGNGGNISVTHCNASITGDRNGGEGGEPGIGGAPGQPGAAAPGGSGGNGGTGCGYTAPAGSPGNGGGGGGGNEHGNPSFHGNNGNDGPPLNIQRYDGCDGGGGCLTDDCCDPALPHCCEWWEEDQCLQNYWCHFIYETCDCVCPESPRPEEPPQQSTRRSLFARPFDLARLR